MVLGLVVSLQACSSEDVGVSQETEALSATVSVPAPEMEALSTTVSEPTQEVVSASPIVAERTQEPPPKFDVEGLDAAVADWCMSMLASWDGASMDVRSEDPASFLRDLEWRSEQLSRIVPPSGFEDDFEDHRQYWVEIRRFAEEEGLVWRTWSEVEEPYSAAGIEELREGSQRIGEYFLAECRK